jgi:hypothetical protein
MPLQKASPVYQQDTRQRKEGREGGTERKVPRQLAPFVDNQAHISLVHGHTRVAHHHYERFLLLLLCLPQALKEEIDLAIAGAESDGAGLVPDGNLGDSA